MIKTNEHRVIIVGLSGVGKSTLTKELALKHSDYKIFHTDEYLQHGHYGSASALNMLILDLFEVADTKFIVEGSLCYRLLRTGLEQNIFNPDLIITVLATESERQLRRPGKDYSQMDRIYRTIWGDYINMENILKPRFLSYKT